MHVKREREGEREIEKKRRWQMKRKSMKEKKIYTHILNDKEIEYAHAYAHNVLI